MGILERDLGKRAGLSNELKKGKKKRRALRSGMGNDESDYGEYDSEHDYYFEDDEDASPSEEEELEEEEYYDEEEEEESETYESVDSQGNKVKRKRGKTTKGEGARRSTKGKKDLRESNEAKQANKQQLNMLEDLAKQIKNEKETMKKEQE